MARMLRERRGGEAIPKLVGRGRRRKECREVTQLFRRGSDK